MPTSATCGPGADRIRRRNRFPPAAASRPGTRRKRLARAPCGLAAARGFTLLELLVVVALVALVAALALPNLDRLRGAITTTTERSYILDQFSGLGRHAMLQARALVVPQTRPSSDGELPEAGRPTPDAAREPPHPRRAAAPSGPVSRGGRERYEIDLPEGWAVHLDKPLVVLANGVCLGAELTLHVRGREDFRVRLEPPYCHADSDT